MGERHASAHPEARVSDGSIAPIRAGEPGMAIDEAALERAKHALGVAPTTPRKVGRYRLGEPVGAGAMGVVYRAFDPRLHRDVAVKLLRGQTSHDRLIREARAIAALSHPNVVGVHDAGTFEHAGSAGVYVVMELVDGEPLGRWRAGRTRALDEVVDVFVGAGRGLAAAHAAGIVHRDFKPANVLVDPSGRARVLDFGLATIGVDGGSTVSMMSGDDLPDPRHTATGVVMGTPAFMPPEQHDGAVATPLADQYAFCVSLYEAIAGRLPFRAGSISELAALKSRAAPTWDGVPRPLRRILARGLSPSPRSRYANMDDLLAALMSFRRRHRRRAYYGLGVATVAVMAGALQLGRAEKCDDFEARAAAVWNDDARTRVREDFTASGIDNPVAFSEDVVFYVDEAVSAWISLSEESCRADVEPEAEPAHRARVTCLEAEFTRVALFIEALEGPLETAWVQAAPAGAAALAPDHCRTAVITESRDRDDQKRRDTAVLRATTLLSSARYEDARSVIEQGREDARNAGDLFAESDFAYLAGRLAAYEGNADAAAQHFGVAALLGERGQHWVQAFRGHTRAMSSLSDVGELEAAQVPADQSERLLAQHRMPELDIATYHYNRAIMALRAGEYDESEGWLEKAEPRLMRLFPAPSTWSGHVHNLRASLLRKQGLLREAVDEFAEATRDYEDALPPDHPLLPSFIANHGRALVAAGDVDAGIEVLRRALALQLASRSKTPRREAEVRSRLAESLAHAGDFTGAREQYRALAAIYEALGASVPPEIAADAERLAYGLPPA